jgi:tight adherence protein B
VSRLLVALAGTVTFALLVRAARRTEPRERARHLVAVRHWLPQRVRAALERRLHDAAVDIDPEGAVQLWAAAAAVAGVLALATGPALVVPAVVAVAIGGPVALRVARGRRSRALHAALPATLDVVAGELRAGGTVRTALRAVAAEPGPVQADIARIEARTALGLALDDALAHWVDERDGDAVRAVAGALSVADGVGGRAAAAIDGLARSLRDAQGAAAEARALSAQARPSAVVVAAAPLAYLAFEAVTDPSSIGVLLGTPGGQVCLVVGLGLEVLAAAWMRRIVGVVT